MRTAPPPNTERVASLSSTDPSPGFSLLSEVADNLVVISGEPGDSPSLYSSPPSSPSSSLHTPCIVVSSTIGEFPPEEENAMPPHRLQREPKIADVGSASGEISLVPDFQPDVNGLAKRRNFKGPLIVTNFSKDFLHLPVSRHAAKEDHHHGHLSPKSAFSSISDFVRASAAHKSSRSSSSRDSLAVLPESFQFESSPFSADADSFFVDDDHISSPSTAEIHDFGIYTDAMSTLNLQTPRRKRMAVNGEGRLGLSSRMATNTYYNLIRWGGSGWGSSELFLRPNSDDLLGRSRPLSGLSSMTEVDISSG